MLVLTYNITLRNYIHDRISEVRAGFDWENFWITHYHQFVMQVANNHNVVIDDPLGAADDELLFHNVAGEIERFETILVDEGQDYKPEWFIVLQRYFLADGGEFVVFGDEKQNLYARDVGVDKFARIPGVPGRWTVLNQSFRLADHALRNAQIFQRKFFTDRYQSDGDATPSPQEYQATIFSYAPATRRVPLVLWDPEESYQRVSSFLHEKNVHPNDVAVLALDYRHLRELELQFRHIGGQRTTIACETVEEWQDLAKKCPDMPGRMDDKGGEFKKAIEQLRRHRKLHFRMNAGTTKFATVHSFKGWEAHTIVLVVDWNGTENRDGLEELIYTGLTRSLVHLLIVEMGSSRFSEFFVEIADK